MPFEAWGPDPDDGRKDVSTNPSLTLSWNIGDLDTPGSYVLFAEEYPKSSMRSATSHTSWFSLLLGRSVCCASIFEKGRAFLDEEMWNGERYVHLYRPIRSAAAASA